MIIVCSAEMFHTTYTEVLEVVQGQVVAEQVQHGVLQHATVAVAEDEQVAVDPPDQGSANVRCRRVHAEMYLGFFGLAFRNLDHRIWR